MSTKPPDVEMVILSECNPEDVHAVQNVSASHSAGNFGKLP